MAELVDRHVREGRAGASPSAIAAATAVHSVSYAELAALVNRIAHVLVEDMGLVPGTACCCAGPTT